MKRFVLFVSFCLCAAGLMAQSLAGRQKLVIYTWEEMFPAEIISGFEKDTGIKIEFKTFNQDEEMLASLDKKGGAGYDLVIADDYIIEQAISMGLARKLDKNRIPNFKNIDPVFQYQFYDPNNEYTVPYGAGIQTIVYNPAKVKKPIEGYADLWDPSLKGRIGIIDNYRVVNGYALEALGESINTENLGQISAAGQKLLQLAPNIAKYTTGKAAGEVLIRNYFLDRELLNGTIDVMCMYTEGANRALMKDPSLKLVYPKEGMGFGIMAAFIPSKASNARAANDFLNYILDPEHGADCFEYLNYYCTYAASAPLIKPDLKKYLIMPDLKRFEMIENVTTQEAEDAYQQNWNAFRAALSKN